MNTLAQILKDSNVTHQVYNNGNHIQISMIHNFYPNGTYYNSETNTRLKYPEFKGMPDLLEFIRENGTDLIADEPKKQHPRQGLRPIQFSKFIHGLNKYQQFDGYFHAWGYNYEEFDNDTATYSIGICEDKKGVVHMILAEDIVFLD